MTRYLQSGQGPQAQARRGPEHKPTLSVIVPVYNDAHHLRRCLAALAASRSQTVEILVVDDGSSEPLEPLVSAFGFRYLRLTPRGGPARARNRGVAWARGMIVVFIDADVCVHPDTLERFAAAFEADPGLAAVVGCYDDAPAAPNFLSQYKNLFHRYVHRRNGGEIETFWSGCGAMRREVFRAFGGFDEGRYDRPAIEDIELGGRLSAAGHRILLDGRIQAKHLKQWRFGALLKSDIWDRGVPWVRLQWRARRWTNTLNVTGAQRCNVALIYLLVGMVAAAWWWPPGWGIVAVLILVLLALNRDIYGYMAAQRGLGFALRVVPMHWLYLGYCGFCFLWGTLLHMRSPNT